MDRRDFLAASLAAPAAAGTADPAPPFQTRGVIIYPFDLSLTDWPERAAAAGLTTLGLHAARRLDVLLDFIRSAVGQAFLSRCKKLGLQVEYELHALGDLLSRELFALDPDLFRMDAQGRRNPDANACPSSRQALDLIAAKAIEVGRVLKPTTGRYFYWPDDGRDWCHCPKCRGLSASEQATQVENAVVTILRKHHDPKATLCHLAYSHTLAPPKQVKPHPGLFLEFAPINRASDRSIGERDVKGTAGPPDPATHGGYLDLLDANLEVFGKDTAQVLEYWLDVSRASGWQRPSRKLAWSADLVAADARTYAAHGVRHVTCFGTWIDADYVRRFGEPPLAEYGRALRG